MQNYLTKRTVSFAHNNWATMHAPQTLLRTQLHHHHYADMRTKKGLGTRLLIILTVRLEQRMLLFRNIKDGGAHAKF